MIHPSMSGVLGLVAGRGRPRQLLVIAENSRCSICFPWGAGRVVAGDGYVDVAGESGRGLSATEPDPVAGGPPASALIAALVCG